MEMNMHDTNLSHAHNEDSEFLQHEPCPACGSSDNLARYTDGHAYCFGCDYYEPGDDQEVTPMSNNKNTDLLGGEYVALRKRGISEETCRKFGYRVAEFNGKTVQVADFKTPNGELVGQKVRFPNKDFTCLGDVKAAGLFGQHLWRDSGKMLVITEGEIDCLTVSELQNNKWPVVSILNGAGQDKGARRVAKQLAEHIEWLCGFEKVVIFFDNDQPGQDSAKAVAQLLPPGKAFIAKMPEYKDANEAHQAGEGKKVIQAIWDAKAYRPDGLIKFKDIAEELLKPIEWGFSWPFPSLTKATYGIHRKTVYGLGAGTGIGKTDLFIQTAAHLVKEHSLPISLFLLEQSNKETGQRLGGKLKGKLFHLPDAGWTEDEWHETVEELINNENIDLYNHYGQSDWGIIKSRIRYLATSNNVKDFFIDHLTALATGGDRSEKEVLESIMEDMSSLVQELDITIYFVSHLTTPEGKPHEEGGRVMIRHFKGSRAIGFWAHTLFGLERNQQAEDEEDKKVSVLRILKHRLDGRAVGQTIPLLYDVDTGLLSEKPQDVDDFEDEFNLKEEKEEIHVEF